MKKLLTGITILCSVLSLSSQSMNKLIRCETSGSHLSSRVTLEFAVPLYHESKVDDKNEIITLYFPAIDHKDFQSHGVAEKIQRLKDIEKTTVTFEDDRVVLQIQFKKNSSLLKLAKSEAPNRLMIHIFAKKALWEIKNESSTMRFACNDIFKKKTIQMA
jgi:hypothetical protein